MRPPTNEQLAQLLAGLETKAALKVTITAIYTVRGQGDVEQVRKQLNAALDRLNDGAAQLDEIGVDCEVL